MLKPKITLELVSSTLAIMAFYKVSDSTLDFMASLVAIMVILIVTGFFATLFEWLKTTEPGCGKIVNPDGQWPMYCGHPRHHETDEIAICDECIDESKHLINTWEYDCPYVVKCSKPCGPNHTCNQSNPGEKP